MAIQLSINPTFHCQGNQSHNLLTFKWNVSFASFEFQLFNSEVVIDISPKQSTHHQFMFWDHVFKLSEHTPCKFQAHNQASLNRHLMKTYIRETLQHPLQTLWALVHVFTYSPVHEPHG
jgi:hypothetical protein